ncbi:prophage regulatory protein [Rhizobium sp. BK529]|uniref:helix-turn-helix transcriptional regulator n=1 Tax=Rhizobium sp. BK529 TaxID=2586983 RepID=UPI00160AE444|nr:prophage regulatory protein [Rhizobium sp. BK529]
MTSRILRRPEVQNRTGLPTSTLYAAIADGRFPPPVKIGKRAVGWVEGQVEAWIADRVTDAAPPSPPREKGTSLHPARIIQCHR